ncbi:MAG: hypothetical protein II117_05920 [Clostridia bacterium]|nr:hypothetical protein [Clostridia bacterium]
MKVLKGIGTLIVTAVLIAAVALTLAAGLIRFVAMNPSYVKMFMPSKSYCGELRERISEDLDHVALLYGFGDGELSKLVTDKSIRSYTNKMIDALYEQEDTSVLELPAYPTEAFAEYARKHTSYSEQGIQDFAEDCALAVEEDLSSVNVELVTGQFGTLRSSPIVRYSLILFIAGLMLSVLMIAFLKLMYLGESRRAGAVAIWGGCFMGVTVVFVPVMQFLLFGYVGRLNISVSAFRTILTGYLNTILEGWFFILLALEILTFLLLLIAAFRAGRRRKNRK